MPDAAIQIQIRAQRAHRTCSLFTVHYSLFTKNNNRLPRPLRGLAMTNGVAVRVIARRAQPDAAIQIQIRAQRAHHTCSRFTVHYSLFTKKRIDCTRKGYAASVRRQSRQRLRSHGRRAPSQ